MIAYQGLSFLDVFFLSCHFLPRTLVMGTSWGFALALVWTYRRYNQDHAFNVMRSCGVSPWFFNQPTMLLALLLTGFLYLLTCHMGTIAHRTSRIHEQNIRQRFDPSFITPGLFFSIQDRTLYVHHQPSRYRLQGVFLHDQRDPKNEFILCGQYADIIPHSSGFRMRFENGSMHVFPSNAPPYLAHFKTYTLNYAAPFPKSDPTKQSRPQEQSLDTLLKHPLTDPNNSEYRKEWQYRLFWPLLPLLDALWVPPVMLYSTHWVWRVMAVLLLVHGGILSPRAGISVLCAVMARIVFWIRTRKSL
jgi:lipopolysaccharide export LptBFGC system permease protein LptF